MKIAGTVDRFTVCIRVYIYLVRLISAWIYALTTLALIMITHAIVTSNMEFLDKVNMVMDPAIPITWLCAFLVLLFGCCCFFYGIIARRTPNLTSGDRILLWISLDVFVNGMGTNWIANWLDVPGGWPIRIILLVFWCTHTITTAISLVVIGRRVYIRCVRYSRRSRGAEEEHISLLTMPTIPERSGSKSITKAKRQPKLGTRVDANRTTYAKRGSGFT
jgi:hypothetical protein